MEHSPHVLLVGEGALAFCRDARPRLRRARVFLDRSALAGACSKIWRRRADLADDGRKTRAGTARSARSRATARQSRRRDLDRRDDRQIAGPGRRQPDHRRRHLCRQRDLRGLGDRPRRVLYPLWRRPRDRRAHAPSPADRWPRRRARSSTISAASAARAGSSRSGATAPSALPFNCSGMYRGFVRA